MKSGKELSGRKVAADTLKEVQRAVDEPLGNVPGSSAQHGKEKPRRNKCGYCGEVSHAATRNGITICPLRLQHEARDRAALG